jgi:hypothetical protein
MNFWENDPVFTPPAAGGPGAPPDASMPGGTPALPQFGLPGDAAASGGGIVKVPGGGIVAMPYNNAEAAYKTKLADAAVKMRDEAIANAKNAQMNDSMLAQFETAMGEAKKKGTDTGYFTPALGQLVAGAKSLGIDTSGISGLPKPETVADIQTADKVSKTIMGEVLKKMFPQRITNADITLNQGIAPGFGLDERANQNLIGAMKAQNAYDKNFASSMLDFEANRGNLYGFEREHYSKNGYAPMGFTYNGPGSGAAPAASGQESAAIPSGAVRAAQGKGGMIYQFPDPQKPGAYFWGDGSGKPVQ